ncbi:hypothetical protein HK097_002921 [Rhizophlyctis rosea]|uniref:Uncharacterized protein n=1 Tax=Rhizophlyctis rosea TaxID=64517 RepID=A0AAD5X0C9_9FUNG|nr:hypothetical protein HK097_002921 [Rhizophlyctis rosea]
MKYSLLGENGKIGNIKTWHWLQKILELRGDNAVQYDHNGTTITYPLLLPNAPIVEEETILHGIKATAAQLQEALEYLEDLADAEAERLIAQERQPLANERPPAKAPLPHQPDNTSSPSASNPSSRRSSNSSSSNGIFGPGIQTLKSNILLSINTQLDQAGPVLPSFLATLSTDVERLYHQCHDVAKTTVLLTEQEGRKKVQDAEKKIQDAEKKAAHLERHLAYMDSRLLLNILHDELLEVHQKLDHNICAVNLGDKDLKFEDCIRHAKLCASPAMKEIWERIVGDVDGEVVTTLWTRLSEHLHQLPQRKRLYLFNDKESDTELPYGYNTALLQRMAKKAGKDVILV